jgi:hypothetical protein
VRFKLVFGFALFCSGFMYVLGRVFMPLRWHPRLSLRGAVGLVCSCFRWHP